MADRMALKLEDGISIKPDPDQDDRRPLQDNDIYEDEGELEMPREQRPAWLVRLPKALWDNWAHMDDDQPIQLGMIRHFTKSDRFQLHLNPGARQTQGLPKQYEMRTPSQDVHNTFVFSERDLPGFKGKPKGEGNTGLGGDRKDRVGPQNQSGVDKSARYQSFRRKAIPKQTVLAATINKEVTCIPIESGVEARRQRLDVEVGKGGMTILTGDVRNYARMIIETDAGRPAKSRNTFDNFKTDLAPAKAKPQENKYARMPQNELLDKLYECFKDYRYWSMSALRQKLKQPESYLRQTLPMIADQVRSGPFNNNWKLKPEQNIELAAVKEESAPQRETEADGEGASSAAETGGDDDDASDDEDDLQMEDIEL